MTLDVGDIDRIDDPTAEQVRQFLRVLPARSPFLILTAADGFFIQATHADGDAYRVEYRELDRQWHGRVDFDAAVDVFERFRRGDDSFRRVVRWRRLRVWNDPHSPLVVAILAVPMLALAGWGVWEMLR